MWASVLTHVAVHDVSLQLFFLFFFLEQVVIKNLSNEPRTVSANLTARSIYYTGVHYAVLKKGDGKFPIGPKMTKVGMLFIIRQSNKKKQSLMPS